MSAVVLQLTDRSDSVLYVERWFIIARYRVTFRSELDTLALHLTK